TIVFVDEIHRFNKAQQDAFLPFVEKGSIILIGATTENPSFEVNGALLSRCKVFVLKQLSEDDLTQLLKRAVGDIRGFGSRKVNISDELLKALAVFANGDARNALSTLEMVILNSNEEDGVITVTPDSVEQCTSKKSLLYDKGGEEHYNIISALHKSMRNSDPDAAVYWLARMLESGEDPLYVARRVTRFASEDVGLADPRAMELAVAAYQACHFIGMPECTVHLAEAVIYLSLAPKSNAAYMAYEHAKRDALNQLAEPVPLAIRNAPTRLMKDLGYGDGYKYAHDVENKIADLQCLPDSLVGTEYYKPTEEGVEARIKTRLEQIKAWKEELARRRKK
ncbi:MAG: replication-associated recombination protein A, partial [Spirochaetia bacterium]|nr:replication-associated recombination protein A [Spirochaetia bacterium]